MKKKLIILLTITALIISGCGASATSKESKTSKAAQSETKKSPLDLSGTWKSKNNDGNWMEAEISNSVISINWISDNGNTKSIYWIGTYDAPKDSKDEYKWVSTRDKAKTDNAMLASTDGTKDFSYSDNKISYSASALGTTTTIYLSKSN